MSNSKKDIKDNILLVKTQINKLEYTVDQYILALTKQLKSKNNEVEVLKGFSIKRNDLIAQIKESLNVLKDIRIRLMIDIVNENSNIFNELKEVEDQCKNLINLLLNKES